MERDMSSATAFVRVQAIGQWAEAISTPGGLGKARAWGPARSSPAGTAQFSPALRALGPLQREESPGGTKYHQAPAQASS